MTYNTTDTHLYERAHGLLVRLADQDMTAQLSIDQRILVAEAFEALTDAGADSVQAPVQALFPVPGPPSVQELITRSITSLERIVADSGDLTSALRFTRALDLMRLVHDTGAAHGRGVDEARAGGR